jgi:cytidine deaminase
MNSMDEENEKLVAAAAEARRWAYAPYSNYAVGAAVLAASGRVYDGVNIENAAYPTGMCAERVALFKAVSQGEREFTAIAVVTDNGGSPCGACRQVLSEFGLDTKVVIADTSGKVVLETTVGDLLPGAFGPENLKPSV